MFPSHRKSILFLWYACQESVKPCRSEYRIHADLYGQKEDAAKHEWGPNDGSSSSEKTTGMPGCYKKQSTARGGTERGLMILGCSGRDK